MTSSPVPLAGAASATPSAPAEAAPATPSTPAEAPATASAPVGVVPVVPFATPSAAAPSVGIALAPASSSVAPASPSVASASPSVAPSTTTPTVGIALASASVARPRVELQLVDESTVVPTESVERNLEAPTPLVSAIHVVLPPLDQDAVRSSIDHLSGILDRVAALGDLERDHEYLQRRFRELSDRVDPLERELAYIYATAGPLAAHCQHQYEVLVSRFQASQLVCAEMEGELARRRDNTQELQNAREMLQVAQKVQSDEAAWFLARIDDLQTQLTAARSVSASSPSAATDRRISALEMKLRQVCIDRDAALCNAKASDEAARAWEASSAALEAASAKLRRQVEAQEVKSSDLHEQLRRQARNSQQQLDCPHEERDRLQSRVDLAEAKLKKVAAVLQKRTQDRDRAAAALHSNEKLVGAARSSIARLERRVNDLEVGRQELQHLEAANAVLTTDLAAAQQRCSDLDAARAKAVADYTAIRDRIAGLMTFVQTGTSRSRSASPVNPPPKRKRGHSPSTSRSSPARGRIRRHSPDEVSPPPPPGLQNRSRARSRGQGVPSTSDDDTDDDGPIMQALSKSRAAERRRRQSPDATRHASPRSSATASGRGSPTHPIELTSPDHSDHEDPEFVGPAANTSDRGGGGHHSDDGSSTRSVSSPRSQASVSTGGLLSATALAALPATRAPRDQWIPGYADRRNFVVADVAPWALPEILQLSVRELTVDLLFQKLSKPALWIFPPDGRAPAAQHWSPDLITEANVRALYAATPWDVLDVVVAPVSFDLVDWFEVMANKYTQFEDDFRQALWESTHAFPITTSLRKSSPFFDELADNRKQRRSRLGARWKSLLRFMLRGIEAGHCDLDVFLDRFFLHFPRAGEKKSWFPGLG
ncbi:hypothetical protein PR003_g22942 [Phytophthora rubi]|uniref:Uncharacterized protein n=1 Tax=Phytophthora rubi TaxID=129364 RepID=A0A6A4DBH2_9STRA|nr:hypothetical protein PR003_g22942 [Phytophthora rubi]